jgi:Flp pilus assembly protein CpaB
MKWGIIVLLFLGLVAALCAAVLVGAIKLNLFTRNKAPQTVTVLVAAKDLPAATIMQNGMMEKQTWDLAELPENKRVGRIGEKASIGRVLRVAVVKDEILTESSFLPQGSAEELMAKIPPGMRAFTVRLSTGFPDLALLRPGSIVDIVSITKRARSEGGQSIASPLLNGILVLVVQGRSVVSNSNSEEGGATQRNAYRGVSVTLQVDSQQARALQLATSQGSIALVLRNPRDKMTPPMDPIMLDDGGRYIPVRPEDLLVQQGGEEPNSAVPNPVRDPNQAGGNAVPTVPVPAPKAQPAAQTPPPRSERWKVIVHRGNKTQEEELEEPSNGGADGQATPFGTEKRIHETERKVNETAR